MEDMSKYPGLYTRDGVFYVRKRVPNDILDMYPTGKKEVKQSLKTKDQKVALNLYHSVMNKINYEFEGKRIAKQYKQDNDHLSKLIDKELLALVYEWYTDITEQEEKRKYKDINRQYTDQELYDAKIDMMIDLDINRKSLKTNDFEHIYSTAKKFLDKKSIAFDPHSVAFHKFSEHLIKTNIWIKQRDIKELDGKSISETLPPIFGTLTPNVMNTAYKQEKLVLLEEILEQFLNQPNKTNTDEKNRNNYRTIIKRFQEFSGKKLYVQEVTRKLIEDYRNACIKYPSQTHVLKIYQNKSFHEVLKLAEDRDDRCMSVKTINTHILYIKAVLCTSSEYFGHVA